MTGKEKKLKRTWMMSILVNVLFYVFLFAINYLYIVEKINTPQLFLLAAGNGIFFGVLQAIVTT